LLSQLREAAANVSQPAEDGDEFQQYQPFPERFVAEVLSQTWWSKQIEIGQAIQRFDRVAVKAGHSVGKTHCIGGIANWYLHAFGPCTLVTTAPSKHQLKMEIWKEIRKQAKQAKVPLLPGLLPIETLWRVREDWFAAGYSTDSGEKFRGEHAENMLFILDEASGIPPFVWEEVVNMCTAPGNKILALGNPLHASGEFADCFMSDSSWHQVTISCLDHPNVIHGRQIIPGAVSRSWVNERVHKLCMEIDLDQVDKATDIEWPAESGRWWRTSPIFDARVLGRIPTQGPNILIGLAQVAYARTRPPIEIDELAPVDFGLDVAYQGGDACVLTARRGPCVIRRDKWYGRDPEETTRKTAGVCKEYIRQGLRIGTIAVDAIGIGAGVASGLRALKDDGDLDAQRVIAVQVSERALLTKEYADKRAELAFALADRFRLNAIDLTRIGDAGDDFEMQASRIKWGYDRTGRYKLQSKDEIRKVTRVSPDDFDSLMMCFIDTSDSFASDYVDLMRSG
jgi:hypothetical protein